MASNPRHYWSTGYTQEPMHTAPLRPFPDSSLPSKGSSQNLRKTYRKASTSRLQTSSGTNETSTILLETIARIQASQPSHTRGAHQPPPPPPPPPPPSNTAAIHASLRTRFPPYSSKPLALSETKFPPPHRSGPSASSNINSEDLTPAHLIDEAISRLEQYERHAKPTLDKYYVFKQGVAAAAAAGPPQPDPASAGAGAGAGAGKARDEPVQKNELDISRDPRLRR